MIHNLNTPLTTHYVVRRGEAGHRHLHPLVLSSEYQGKAPAGLPAFQPHPQLRSAAE